MKTNQELLDYGIQEIPQTISRPTEIKIPIKLHKVVDHIPNHLLKNINKNVKVAKELCLYFTSFITQTMFDDYIDGKHLLSKKIQDLIKPLNESINTNSSTYLKIINALVAGTDNGPIIIVDTSYQIEKYSKKYNLIDRYKKGIQTYTLKTQYVKDIVYRNQLDQYKKAITNEISKNLLTLYPLIQLPTKEELLEKGKELCKNNYYTKKGKKLTMRYRKDKSYWKENKNRAFVEDDILMFQYYTENGFIIPIIGDTNCPRVFDSLSLLPSWIRNEIKINNEKIIEADYQCLHPNLIMNIYNGKSKYLTHKQISDELNITTKEVKTAHLSFFNQKINTMSYSIVFDYYNRNETEVLEKIMNDKKIFNSHKITSKLLFTLESQLMSNVIKKLNQLNIYVVYIYDALITTQENIENVIKIMNETALEMNIYTECKLENNESKETKTITDMETQETKNNSPQAIKMTEKTIEKIRKNIKLFVEQEYIMIDNRFDIIANKLINILLTNKDLRFKDKFEKYMNRQLTAWCHSGIIQKR